MNGIRSSSAATVASGLRSAAPTSALKSIAATRKAAAMPKARVACDRLLFTRTASRCFLHRLRDLRDELRQARPPAGGDVVVQPDDLVVLDRGDRRPARPGGDDRGRLAAVGRLVVRQEDDLRFGGDDVLLG